MTYIITINEVPYNTDRVRFIRCIDTYTNCDTKTAISQLESILNSKPAEFKFNNIHSQLAFIEECKALGIILES